MAQKCKLIKPDYMNYYTIYFYENIKYKIDYANYDYNCDSLIKTILHFFRNNNNELNDISKFHIEISKTDWSNPDPQHFYPSDYEIITE